DAVAAEIAQYVESVALHLRLHLASHHREPLSGSHRPKTAVERRLGTAHQALPELRHRRHPHRDGGVGEVAIELDGDVEGHEVALLQATRPRHPMHRLVVYADAGGPGEIVDQVRS